MRKFRFIFILSTVAIASAVWADGDREDHKKAVKATSSPTQSVSHPAPHTNPHQAVHSVSHQPCHGDYVAVRHLARHSDHDHAALADIHDYLQRRFGNAHPELHTLGKADNWSHEWELRWVDYHGEHGHGRIYHAIHKRCSHRRFTMVSDPQHPHEHKWHRVH